MASFLNHGCSEDGEVARHWHNQDQSKNEQQRLQGEQWFRAALENSFDAVYFLRSVRNEVGAIIDFQFLDLNEQGARLISRSKEEVIGQWLCKLLPINQSLEFFDRYKQVVETGIPLEEEGSVLDMGIGIRENRTT